LNASNQQTTEVTDMTIQRRNWRVTPSEFVAHHVERLAREENRSIANMLEMLLRQSVNTRLQAHRADQSLVATIRGGEALK
jgi:hypothetical protein